MSQAAFALSLPTKDKPVYGVANDMQGNVVLLAFDEVKAGAMPEAQKKSDGAGHHAEQCANCL